MNYLPSKRSTTQIVAAILILQVVSSNPVKRSPGLVPHHFAKRSFFDIQCKGVYDKSIFARLDRICEDCYNLFREPQLHNLCRSQCFTTQYFTGCVESLLLNEEMPKLRKMIEYLAK